MPKAIIYEKKDHLAILTMNRPRVMNAMNAVMRREMGAAFIDFRDDSDSRVLIVTGAGDQAFSAGTDIQEMAAALGSDRAAGPVTENPDLAKGNIDIWKPVIAAINGVAVGSGFELALGCDVRIVAEHARLGLMEPRRGIVPGGKGAIRLSRLVPPGIALEMLFSGDLIDAQEALRIGLANQVVPGPAVLNAAIQLAAKFLACAPLALQSIKQEVYNTLGLPLQQALAADYGAAVFASADAREGLTAFLEKRKPVWQGR
jgi:enoyl-CoA hydratase/carnithine racemase